MVGIAHEPIDEKSWKENSALWVVDISDPASPRQTGSCKLSKWGPALDVTVVGKYAYVADGAKGLAIVDVSDPAAPKRVGGWGWVGLGFVRAVAVDGDKAFVAEGRNGLRIPDICDPAAPKPIGFYDSPPAR